MLRGAVFGLVGVTAFGPAKNELEVPEDECIPGFDAPIAPACKLALEQSPADVTEGYQGERDPKGIVHEYDDLCQVNVHWHLGAEHRSEGQYDIDGDDFIDNVFVGEVEADDHDTSSRRRLLSYNAGFMCQGYDATDPKYTTPYDWKYCKEMHVGLTYEIHWPRSSAGHCGRLSDGLGGVFCKSHAPKKIGVEGQVFVIVNDDAYDVEDLAHGMNYTLAGDNVAKYSGSTTGTAYNNGNACSPYAPISWHVDRSCHLVSAKSFDAMCKTMKEYGMEGDLHAHGSRDLVDPAFVSSQITG